MNFTKGTRVTNEKDAKKAIKVKMKEAKFKTKQEGKKYGVINGELENMTITNSSLGAAMADDFDNEDTLRAEIKENARKMAEQRKTDFKEDYEKIRGQMLYIKSFDTIEEQQLEMKKLYREARRKTESLKLFYDFFMNQYNEVMINGKVISMSDKEQEEFLKDKE